jgi:hypothetical protein
LKLYCLQAKLAQGYLTCNKKDSETKKVFEANAGCKELVSRSLCKEGKKRYTIHQLARPKRELITG